MRSKDVSFRRAYSVTLVSRDPGLLRITCHRFAYSLSLSYDTRFSLMLSLRHSPTTSRLRHDYVCRLDLLRYGDVGMTSMPFTLPVPDTTSLLPGSLSPHVTYPTGRYSRLLPLWTLRLFVLVSP